MKRHQPSSIIGRALLTCLLWLPVVAQGAADCSVSTSAISFGNYDVLSATPTDSTTNVFVVCLRNPPPGNEVVNYTLTLSVGGGSYAARTMSNGGSTIDYNLYISPAMNAATIWGDGTGGTATVSGSVGPLTGGNPVGSATHTIYGRIPAGQDVPVGTYSGSVVLTMNY